MGKVDKSVQPKPKQTSASAPREETKSSPSGTSGDETEEQSTGEQATRWGVRTVHWVGQALIGAYAGPEAAKEAGKLDKYEQQGVGAAFAGAKEQESEE